MLLLRKIHIWHLQGLLDVATVTKGKEIWRKHSEWGSEVEKKIQNEYLVDHEKIKKNMSFGLYQMRWKLQA